MKTDIFTSLVHLSLPLDLVSGRMTITFDKWQDADFYFTVKAPRDNLSYNLWKLIYPFRVDSAVHYNVVFIVLIAFTNQWPTI